jgi:Skp family chaperone for outer membrane proteins
MAPADFRAAADAFDLEAEAIRRSQAEKRARLASYQDTEQQRFFQLAAPVLRQVLLLSGAQVIIDARAVILGVDGMDLTADALRAVDTALGDGAPAPTPLDVP